MTGPDNAGGSGLAQNSQKYYPALDGLRAISVVLVILEHVRQRSSFLAHLQGWLGVDVFLVLSGFLITTLLLREEAETGRVALSAFYGRRFFRIIPAYALMLGIYCAVCHTDPAKWAQMKYGLPYYLTLTNEFVRFGTPFSATWTIAVEEKFYLLWPVLFFFVCQKRWRSYAIPLLMGACFLLPFRMARSYFDLFAGCVLAVLLTHASASKWRAALTRIPLLALIAGVVAGSVLVDRNYSFVYLFAVIVALLVGNLVLQTSWLSMILGSPAFVWVGRRSYSMYLVHGLAIDAVQHWLSPSTVVRQLGVAILASAAAALGADLIYRTIEEPARRFGRSWTRRWESSQKKQIMLPSSLTALGEQAPN